MRKKIRDQWLKWGLKRSNLALGSCLCLWLEGRWCLLGKWEMLEQEGIGEEEEIMGREGHL